MICQSSFPGFAKTSPPSSSVIPPDHFTLQLDFMAAATVLELAGEHWEIVLWALVLFRYVYPAHSGYVPQTVWQDLLARFAKELCSPDSKARFRGSLIDDKMFAIDIKEWGLDDLFNECRARHPKISAMSA